MGRASVLSCLPPKHSTRLTSTATSSPPSPPSPSISSIESQSSFYSTNQFPDRQDVCQVNRRCCAVRQLRCCAKYHFQLLHRRQQHRSHHEISMVSWSEKHLRNPLQRRSPEQRLRRHHPGFQLHLWRQQLRTRSHLLPEHHANLHLRGDLQGL